MKKYVWLVLFSFLLSSAFAQETYTISGYIEDVHSSERLIGANVYLPEKRAGTSTNTYGFYSITLPKDSVTILVSLLGYETQELKVYLEKNIQYNFLLREVSSELEEVTVTAEELPVISTQMSQIELSSKQIKKIPAFLGEVDVIKALQLLPGVQSGNEGTSGFYVRGGSPDQNLILLDGVPVYNASHLFGFFSVFNPDAIKNVTLTKGGFPARFGGRLSSVLEIDLKEGNMKEYHGEGSLGLISSKFTIEGPIVKDKTSFIVSGRRTFYDLIAKAILPANEQVGYYFGDINAKVNHVFSRKDRLFLSFYNGIDKFESDFREDYNGYTSSNKSLLNWGNNTGSLRWNHLYNDKLFSNLTATFTDYKFRVGSEQKDQSETYSLDYFSRIRDYGLRYDFDYLPVTDHSIKFGASYTYHIFRPGALQVKEEYNEEQFNQDLELSKPIFSNDLYFYAEDNWQITDRIKVNGGLHYGMYLTQESNYNSLQPRFSGRYLLNDQWSVKGSYAYMMQFIHLLSNTGLGLPTDLWVSSTSKVPPQRSHQVALGTVKNFDGNTWEISSEVYYKTMSNLIAYKEGASFLSLNDWQTQVETGGKGNAYGFELLLRKNKGKTTGWIGYTLAWTNRNFENINGGKTYPYRYDRRHDISIVLNHEFNKKIDVGLTWVYSTGIAFTGPLAEYYNYNLQKPHFTEIYTEHLSDRNALRYPAYHRLDLGINFHKKTSWGERTINISAYNAYNRINPFFMYIGTNDQGEESLVKVGLFPIIPSISYSFRF